MLFTKSDGDGLRNALRFLYKLAAEGEAEFIRQRKAERKRIIELSSEIVKKINSDSFLEVVEELKAVIMIGNEKGFHFIWARDYAEIVGKKPDGLYIIGEISSWTKVAEEDKRNLRKKLAKLTLEDLFLFVRWMQTRMNLYSALKKDRQSENLTILEKMTIVAFANLEEQKEQKP